MDSEKSIKNECLCICIICGKSFESPKLLLSHIRSNHPNEVDSSEIGSVTDTSEYCETLNLSSPAESNSTLKSDVTEAIPNFDCNLCDRTYKCKQSFDFHIQVFHQININHKFCTLCNKMFESQSGLRAHMSTVHAIKHAKKSSAKSADLICPKCEAVFRWRQSYKKHVARCGDPHFSSRSCSKRDLNNNLISSDEISPTQGSQNITKNPEQSCSAKKIKSDLPTPSRQIDKQTRVLEELAGISPKVKQQLDKWLSLETSENIPSPVRKRNTRVNNVILDCLIRAVEAADQATNNSKPNPTLLLTLD